MKVYILDDNFELVPWWHNFYEYLRSKYPHGEDRTEQTILIELKLYNAKLVRAWHRENPHVIFDTEQDYVMFVLRWS